MGYGRLQGCVKRGSTRWCESDAVRLRTVARVPLVVYSASTGPVESGGGRRHASPRTPRKPTPLRYPLHAPVILIHPRLREEVWRRS